MHAHAHPHKAWWIGFGIIGGVVFYQQSSQLSSEQWVVFVAGGILMVVGCWLLVFQKYNFKVRAPNMHDLTHIKEAVARGTAETARSAARLPRRMSTMASFRSHTSNPTTTTGVGASASADSDSGDGGGSVELTGVPEETASV